MHKDKPTLTHPLSLPLSILNFGKSCLELFSSATRSPGQNPPSTPNPPSSTVSMFTDVSSIRDASRTHQEFLNDTLKMH